MGQDMKIRSVGTLFAAALAMTGLPARAAGEPDGRRWWSHVAFLADDKLEGRDTGSEGHRKAAAYVAARVRKGRAPARRDRRLSPAGQVQGQGDRRGPFEPRPGRQGRRGEPLTLGPDAIVSLRVDPAPSVDAEMVFAGYGLANAEAGHDDFAGLDVRGKVVVYLAGRPALDRRARWPPTCSRPASGRRSCGSWARSGRSRSRTPRTWTSPGSGPAWPGSCRR